MDREFAIDENESLIELIESAVKGEEIVLTMGGQPVGKIVPPAPTFDRAEARAAFERIMERGKTMTLGGLTFKQLINEGRKY